MSTKAFFDHDPLTGITEWFHQEADGSFAIEAVQDVTEIVEANKRLQNLDTMRYGKRGFTEVACLPLVILQDLQTKGILDMTLKVRDQKRFRQWLNDRDNMMFRTKLGRV